MREKRSRIHRRLTALLLAAAMMVSAAPFSLAAPPCDEGMHVPAAGEDMVVAPTCGEGGYTEHTCSVCGEKWQDTPTEPTGLHSYVYVHDGVNGHNRKCSVCSAMEFPALQAHDMQDEVVAPTCTADGYTEHSCVCGYSFRDTTMTKREHDFSLSYLHDETHHWNVCLNGSCPEKGNYALHTVSNWVENTQNNTRTGNCSVCAREITEDLRALYTVTYRNGSTSVHTESVRDGAHPTYDGVPSYTGTGTGVFVGWSTASGGVLSSSVTPIELSSYTVTRAVTLYAVYTVSVSDKAVAVRLDNRAAYTFSGSLSGGSAVSLLNAAMRSVGSDLTYVRFGTARSSTYGMLYTNSGRTALSSELKYYYSALKDGNEPLSGVYFVPTGSAGTYGIDYTGYDAYGNSVSGLLSITVPTDRIEYAVKSNATVALTTSVFNTFFQKTHSSTSPRWVVFDTGTEFSTSNGYLYYNYGGSNQTRLTNSTIDDYRFYYSSSSYGSMPLSGLTFVPGTSTSNHTVSVGFTAYYSDSVSASGVLRFNVTYEAATGTVGYELGHEDTVDLVRGDFNTFFQKTHSGYTMRWLVFDTGTEFGSSKGYLYYDYGGSSQTRLSNTTVDNYNFYYSDSAYGDWPLSGLTFVPGNNTGDYTVSVGFTACYSNTRSVKGTLTFTVEQGSATGTVGYELGHEDTVDLVRGDFNTFFQKTHSGYTMRWLVFDTGTEFGSSKGYLYYDYGGSSQTRLTNATVDNYNFYYSDSAYGDWPLSGLTFVPGNNTGDYTISVGFTAYYSNTRSVKGTLTFTVGQGGTGTAPAILYRTTSSSLVSLRSFDFNNYFKQTYPAYDLQYVTLTGVPSQGTLYYNYSGTSTYGSRTSVRLTSSNYASNNFYYAPSSTSYYSLDQLTYVPSGSNYCVTIPFRAVYNSSRTVEGEIVISVTSSAVVNNVYYVTTRGTRITLDGADFNTNIRAAIGTSYSYIRFDSLPTEAQGTLYYDYTSASSYGHKVTQTRQYSYSGGDYTLSKLTFVPASGYAGAITIPFRVYNSSGTALAAGNLCIGVVRSRKTYPDAPHTGWYYQYVTELSDAGIIGGYEDGTFRPSGKVTWGEALKLVMLAAGYPEQAQQSGRHWAYGYMTLARSNNILSKDVTLQNSVTRLEVAEIAAKALKLGSSSVTSPFSDTSNGYVLSLYRNGIVEGSLDSKGVQSYKPSNNITRAEITTIIWRMNRLGS